MLRCERAKPVSLEASVFIAVPRLQALAHPVGDFQEFRRLADIERSVCRQVCFDHIDDRGRALGSSPRSSTTGTPLREWNASQTPRFFSSPPRAPAIAGSACRARFHQGLRKVHPSAAVWAQPQGPARWKPAAACRRTVATEIFSQSLTRLTSSRLRFTREAASAVPMISSGSPTFFSTVRQGYKAGAWNT